MWPRGVTIIVERGGRVKEPTPSLRLRPSRNGRVTEKVVGGCYWMSRGAAIKKAWRGKLGEVSSTDADLPMTLGPTLPFREGRSGATGWVQGFRGFTFPSGSAVGGVLIAGARRTGAVRSGGAARETSGGMGLPRSPSPEPLLPTGGHAAVGDAVGLGGEGRLLARGADAARFIPRRRRAARACAGGGLAGARRAGSGRRADQGAWSRRRPGPRWAGGANSPRRGRRRPVGGGRA